jgi:hypothetical protein
VKEYCGGCGVVLDSPLGVGGVLHVDDREKEARYRRTETMMRSAITGRTNAAACVPWADVNLYLDRPRIRDHQLYTQWNGTKINPVEVAVHLRKYLGMQSANDAFRIDTPIGKVVADERLVQHPLNPQYRDRYNADHLRFFPLVPTSLVLSDEINEMPARAEALNRPARPETYHFIKVYELGDRLITHLVVVHRRDMYVITAYRYDDEQDPGRLDKDRIQGVVRHSRIVQRAV